MVLANTGATGTAWLLIAAAFALPMLPAFALFYAEGGHRCVARRAVLRALLAVSVVSVQWVLLGQSLAFGTTRHGVVGWATLGSGVFLDSNGHASALALYRLMFALVGPAILAGLFAERIKALAYVAFVVGWSTFVYDPIAHWVWADGGWLRSLGAFDASGATVVHLPVGLSALVCAAAVGQWGRRAYPLGSAGPLTKLAGAVVLWIGCLGFNSVAMGNARLALLAFVTTQLGAAGGAMGWFLVQWGDRGKAKVLGVASGTVAGLVAIASAATSINPSAALAIGFTAGAVAYGTALGAVVGVVAAALAVTAAAGYVPPTTAIGLAFLSGAICYGAVLLKDRLSRARSPDAFANHAIAAIAGALLVGIFARKALNDASPDGALFGNSHQVWVQLVACVAIGTYATVMTMGLLKAVDMTIGLRAAPAPPEPRLAEASAE